MRVNTVRPPRSRPRGLRHRRVLHLSSGSVYGASGEMLTVTEDTPRSRTALRHHRASEAALRLADLSSTFQSPSRLYFGRWEYAPGAGYAGCRIDCASRPIRHTGDPAALATTRLALRAGCSSRCAGLLCCTRRHLVYNLAAGFMWSIATSRPAANLVGLEWRFASRAGGQHRLLRPYDRSPMVDERLRGDTAFLPRYNLDEALADYLQWLGPAFDPVSKASGKTLGALS